MNQQPVATTLTHVNPLDSLTAEHVMIGTDNYQDTLNWYQQKLEFSIKKEWTVPEFPGVKLAYIEKNGFVIEVVETPDAFQGKRQPQDLGTALSDRGFGHLAFVVNDVDEVMQALKTKGVDAFFPATSFPDVGRRVAFIRDNNGNLIEFAKDLG